MSGKNLSDFSGKIRILCNFTGYYIFKWELLFNLQKCGCIIQSMYAHLSMCMYYQCMHRFLRMKLEWDLEWMTGWFLQVISPTAAHGLHTEKSFRNLIKSNRTRIVFTNFRLIWHQTDFVWCYINRKMVFIIWFRFDLIRCLCVHATLTH